MTKRLTKEFFNRNTVSVAQELLGKTLHFYNFSGVITETEAYRGSDDPASHAYKGPTKRSTLMFQEPGYSYIYMIYGMYFCLNIVTEACGVPGAVLIRGLKLKDIHLNGPGKLCKHLNINKTHNKTNLAIDPHFYLSDTGISQDKMHFKQTPRIGIKNGADKLWRFVCNIDVDA